VKNEPIILVHDGIKGVKESGKNVLYLHVNVLVCLVSFCLQLKSVGTSVEVLVLSTCLLLSKWYKNNIKQKFSSNTVRKVMILLSQQVVLS